MKIPFNFKKYIFHKINFVSIDDIYFVHATHSHDTNIEKIKRVKRTRMRLRPCAPVSLSLSWRRGMFFRLQRGREKPRHFPVSLPYPSDSKGHGSSSRGWRRPRTRQPPLSRPHSEGTQGASTCRGAVVAVGGRGAWREQLVVDAAEGAASLQPAVSAPPKHLAPVCGRTCPSRGTFTGGGRISGRRRNLHVPTSGVREEAGAGYLRHAVELRLHRKGRPATANPPRVAMKTNGNWRDKPFPISAPVFYHQNGSGQKQSEIGAG
jgi:hypothetical protein